MLIRQSMASQHSLHCGRRVKCKYFKCSMVWGRGSVFITFVALKVAVAWDSASLEAYLLQNLWARKFSGEEASLEPALPWPTLKPPPCLLFSKTLSFSEKTQQSQEMQMPCKSVGKESVKRKDNNNNNSKVKARKPGEGAARATKSHWEPTEIICGRNPRAGSPGSWAQTQGPVGDKGPQALIKQGKNGNNATQSPAVPHAAQVRTHASERRKMGNKGCHSNLGEPAVHPCTRLQHTWSSIKQPGVPRHPVHAGRTVAPAREPRTAVHSCLPSFPPPSPPIPATSVAKILPPFPTAACLKRREPGSASGYIHIPQIIFSKLFLIWVKCSLPSCPHINPLLLCKQRQ